MGVHSPFRLILGSSSPARRYLLERDGYAFEVRPAHIDEPTNAGYPNPRQLVQHIAWLKAEAVAPQVTEGILLTADTVAWLDGQVLGKPASAQDARAMLRRLSGRTHEVITGLFLIHLPGGVTRVEHETTRVTFAPLTDEEIDAYVATGEPFDKAGAYAIQGRGGRYVTRVEGCYFNVVGLPLARLYGHLRELGWQG